MAVTISAHTGLCTTRGGTYSPPITIAKGGVLKSLRGVGALARELFRRAARGRGRTAVARVALRGIGAAAFWDSLRGVGGQRVDGHPLHRVLMWREWLEKT